MLPMFAWKRELKWDYDTEILRLDSLFSVGLESGQAEASGGAQWAGDTFTKEKAHHSWFPSAGQFIILVIDSTDRDRLLTTREELYKMLAHEVSPVQMGEGPVSQLCDLSLPLSFSELHSSCPSL